MRKVLRLFVILIIILAVIAGILFILGNTRTRGAGIAIETTPVSTVYIDGKQVGRTPYKEVREAGEITIKLIPDSFEKPLAPYESKITITSDVQTVVKRTFAETDDLASGVIVSYEKVGGSETSISTISMPDAAQVAINGQVKGFTPYKTSSITSGEYSISLEAPGYEGQNISVKAVTGYKLTAVFKLTPDANAPKTERETEQQEEEPAVKLVQILDTGTGFLRVREGPSVGDKEIGRVEVGKTYTFVEEDKDSGWFKVEYEEGKEGWVTDDYAKLVESSPTPTPTPKSSPKPTPST